MKKWRFYLIFVSLLLLLYVAIFPLNSISAQTPTMPFPDARVPVDIPVNPYPKLDSILNRLVASNDSMNISDDSLMLDPPEILSLLASFGEAYSGTNVLVNILLYEENSAIQSFIAQAGGSIAHAYPDIIEAYVPSNTLSALSHLDGVRFIEMITPPSVSIIGEGAYTHNVPIWHTHEYTGNGVKVGVIDLGFDGIISLQGTELPSNISAMCFISAGISTTNINDCDSGNVHGSAVSEAVIDIAPNVDLYVAKVVSLGDIKAATEWMISQGVQVINMSLSTMWTGQGDGLSLISSSSLNSVSLAVDNGIVWVNSAGNYQQETWNNPWNDSGLFSDPNGFLNFTCSSSIPELLVTNEISAGTKMDFRLRWEDDWNSPKTDLALHLYYFRPSLISWFPLGVSSDNLQIPYGYDPIERIFEYAPLSTKYGLAVLRKSGLIPDFVQIQSSSPLVDTNCQTSRSVAEPADSPNPGMLAVGATNWQTPTTIAPYSSRGPTMDGRVKPDIVAVDNADSVSYVEPFQGTSQASPHVAGLAALLLEQYPSYSPAQVKNYLVSNAIGQGTVPNNTWGYGLAHLGNLPPTAPTNVTASAGFEEATVEFDLPSSNGGSSITSYTITANPPDAEKILMVGGAPSVIITGLYGGIPYTFRIRATNSVGDSPYSIMSNSIIPSSNAKKVGFNTQPGNGTAGSILSPQPVVSLQDIDGYTKTSASNPVTVTITSGSGKSGAILQGTTTVTPVNGVATFTDLRIDNAGSGYTFTASATGLQSSTSAQFTVSGGTAIAMSFSSFPPHAIKDQSFSPQLIVLLIDVYGNPASNVGTVSIAIVNGTGGVTASLIGTKTVDIVNGVATFTDLNIDTSSRDYKLVASTSGLSNIISLPFTVFIETVGPLLNSWGIGIIGIFVATTWIYLYKKKNHLWRKSRKTNR